MQILTLINTDRHETRWLAKTSFCFNLFHISLGFDVTATDFTGSLGPGQTQCSVKLLKSKRNDCFENLWYGSSSFAHLET